MTCDPVLRELLKHCFSDLKRITEAAAAPSLPYHFHFNRALDLTEKDYGETIRVVKITGNYDAAYSTELMKPDERASPFHGRAAGNG